MEQEIKNILQQQYQWAQEYFGERHILGIFIYGNLNYNIVPTITDYRAEIIYLPSIEEMVISAEPIFEKRIIAEHHLKIRDFRTIFSSLANNVNEITEALYTKYYIINPIYKDIFEQELRQYREIISIYNRKNRCKGAYQGSQKYLNTYYSDHSSNTLTKAYYLYYLCYNLLDNISYENLMDLKTYFPEQYEKTINIRQNKYTDTQLDTLARDLQQQLTELDITSCSNTALPKESLEMLNQELMKIFTLSTQQIMPNSEFIAQLTENEKLAFNYIKKIINNEGYISISKICDETKLSRPVLNNLLTKMKNTNFAIVQAKGAKGTYIKFNK